MNTRTEEDTRPTLRHWLIAFGALAVLNIGIPLLAAAVSGGLQ